MRWVGEGRGQKSIHKPIKDLALHVAHSAMGSGFAAASYDALSAISAVKGRVAYDKVNYVLFIDKKINREL